MGFDIECIVNIQTYPGEYFCPVCRTLVYPNEAFQSQCTHLYCKPCLSHVANTTKACPYDGYLVTEADSKPLIESDKALAENIGKVKVHCLFHRSGCTWEGMLSESSSHCSGCTFGNSSVICNRCGIQIVHRQVHDHAQTCAGAYQAVDANQNVAASAVTTSTTYVDQNHAVAQSGPSTSQAQISQTSSASLPSGQGTNQQATTGSQGAAVAPGATPTPDQWYQQQYYQQYAGYNPYQQSYQQYYPYQQAVGQTYQQGQYNSQAYVQPQPQPQAQAQFQSYPVHQVPTQPHPSQQPQPQSQSQSQEKVSQPPVAVQGTNQLQSQVQAAAAPHYPQVNSQQQFSSSQQPHPQGSAALHSQPQAQQYGQVPGYQQPVQSTHTAVASQSVTQPLQPQNPLQPQIQPQNQLHHQSLPYSQQYPPQINQPPIPNVQPRASHPSNAVVTGHLSYQPPQQIPMVPPQQLAVHSHGHVPQPASSARPPLSHGLGANQQKPAVPTHMPNNHPTQLQQLHPHAHPPASVVQHQPGIQSSQQSMPHQSQAFHAPLQGQYSHYGQQQPLSLRPHGAAHVRQPSTHGYNPSHQNTPLVAGFIPQQPQNYGSQSQMLAPGGYGPTAQSKPMPLGSSQSSGNNISVKRESDALTQVQSQKDINVRTDTVEHKAGNSGTHIKMEKESIEETRDESGSSRIVVNDSDKEVKKSGASEPVNQQTVKEECTGNFSDTPSGKSLGASAVEENIGNGVRKESESLSNQKEAFIANRDSQSTTLRASNANGSNKFPDPLKSRSLHSSGLRPQAPGFSPTALKSQRSDHLPPHAPINGFLGSGSTATYGRGRGIGGPQPRNFGLHSGPLGHGPTGMDSSTFGLRADRFDFQAGEHVNPFPVEQIRPFDQDGTVGPPSRFMPPPLRPDIVPERDPHFGGHDGFRGKADPSRAADFLRPNPGYGRNHGMPPHDREYLGMPPREPHAFGEGPRPFNLPPDSVGGSLHGNRFPGLPSNMPRIEHGGTEHLRYGEHITPGHRHHHFRSHDPFEEEFLSGLSRRGDMSGPESFPGHFRSGDGFPGGGRMGEMTGGFPHHLPGRESFRGNFSDFPPRLGEPGFRSNYSRQGFVDDRFYNDDVGPFDNFRKRKPLSMGWCRICKIDCESVDGLDMHSQTREHQRMAMDMVKTIKQQNKKNSKISGDHASTMEANKARNVGFEGRGNKP